MTLGPWEINPLRILRKFSRLLQMELFPRLVESVGELTPELKLLASVEAMLPLEAVAESLRAATGRPQRDRRALAMAFYAKAVLNLDTTRSMMGRLKVDEPLRRICGFTHPDSIPDESTFSRAFAQFARCGLGQRMLRELVEATHKGRLVGHISRDSTAIETRERLGPEELAKIRKKARAEKAKKKKDAKAAETAAKQKKPAGKPKGAGKGPQKRMKAADRGTRIQRQRHMPLEKMLAELPALCGSGTKKSSKGEAMHWYGHKLHIDVADGQIPISALLTGANVHDSQAAIPLMTMTSRRVTYLYDLMDSAYDADPILEHSREMGHVPVVMPHARRTRKAPTPELRKAFPEGLAPQMEPAHRDRMRERTSVERIFARLKDEFGARQVRVRGAAKVMEHLMFGLVALTVDQWLRMEAAPT